MPLGLLITMIIIVGPTMAGVIGDAECPTDCTCSPVDSYVNTLQVTCSMLALSDLPAMLNPSTVHTLDLSNNKLSLLKNASFSSYSSLSILILSSSKVDKIEINAFAGLQMMIEIDLSYNKLQSLDKEIFSSNPVLEYVSLQGNPIAFISSDSPILISTSISTLDLKSCSLTSVNSVTFSGLPSLYALDLSYNLLRTISVTTFEKLPKLSTLKLDNNRWTCDCDISEVMQWLAVTLPQEPTPKPVRCSEGQSSTKLWSAAGGSKLCNESTTTEAPVSPVREFATDISVGLPAVSVSVSQSTPAESETEGWDILLSWNSTTLCLLVILPIALGIAVFLALMATNYISKKCRLHPSQHQLQRRIKGRRIHSRERLLRPQLTADHTKHPGYLNRSSDSFGSAQGHVYEEILN
jgi:hypothetical protein